MTNLSVLNTSSVQLAVARTTFFSLQRQTLLALLLFASALFGHPLAQTEQMLALTNANVIDATGAALQTNMTLMIANGRIKTIGASSRTSPAPGSAVIDAAGKFVIPGLWDMHVHWYEPESLKLFLANGVTGVRITLGYPVHFDWRTKISAGALLGPRLFVGSNVIDGPRPIWPGTVAVRTPEEAVRAVADARASGADFLKIYSLLPREAFLALAAECRKLGVSFVGHAPELVSAAEASEAGLRSFEHLLGIAKGCSSREAELITLAATAIERFTRGEDSYDILRPGLKQLHRMALDSYNDQKADDLFALLKQNQTWQCPTLVTLRNTSHLGEPSITADSRVRYMPSDILSRWNPTNDHRLRSMTPEDIASERAAYQKQVALVGALHRAGVGILAGTDALSPYAFPGFSLHDELELLVEAGLKPIDALQAATLNAARYMKRENDLGTVQEGKWADLILLDANPLLDIKATRRIHAVIFGGRYFAKHDLNGMLSEVEALREASSPRISPSTHQHD